MAAFLVSRAVRLAIALPLLAVVTFVFLRLAPGDPAASLAGLNPTHEQIAEVHRSLGLDAPILTQATQFFLGLLHGNLGVSYSMKLPVTEVLGTGLGASSELALVALGLMVILSIPLGIAAAALTREGRHPKFELVFAAVTSVGGAVPEFLTATFLAFAFAVTFRLLPVAGADSWQALIMPALAMVLRPSCLIARVVRVECLDVLANDYIRTARSKRLSAATIYLRHVLPNVLTVTLNFAGVLFTGLVGSAVLVENVFARPGIGTILINAILTRDYPVIQGCVLLLGVVVVVINTLVDIVMGVTDPRSLVRWDR